MASKYQLKNKLNITDSLQIHELEKELLGGDYTVELQDYFLI